MNDLWPDDIGTTEEIGPLAILKEQASLLGEKTGNVVEAKLQKKFSEVEKYEYQDFIDYDFVLIGKALGHYRYVLFSVSQSFDIYPLKILIGSDLGKEIGFSEAKIIVFSQEELIGHLKSIFSARKTRNVIKSMLDLSGI